LLLALGLLLVSLANSEALPGRNPFPEGENTAPEQEIRRIGMDAYIYGYPLVLMEMTRRAVVNVIEPNGMGRAPMNRFGHFRAFPDSNFAAVVRPNADTLYSSLWYDVSSEPLIIRIPDSAGRYYLMPTLDMWTDVFSSRGTRTTGNRAQAFALATASWKGSLPEGIDLVRTPTPMGWMIGRTQTNGPMDYPSVHKFQAGWEAIPLSRWGKPFSPPLGLIRPAWIPIMPPVQAVEKMEARVFFSLMAELMKTHPPHANDYPILDRIRRIGLIPGESLDWAKLSPQTQAILNAVPAEATVRIKHHFELAGILNQGWRLITTSIGTYGTDYLQRASVAYGALGSNTIEDALYPKAFTDSKGQPLDSAKAYRIRFKAEDIPPANAFWSLSLYDDRQLFSPNPINKHALGDRDKLVLEADGSLEILLQRESPGKAKEPNWLPTPPKGSFSLVLRLYWPKAEALDGRWTPPPIERIGD